MRLRTLAISNGYSKIVCSHYGVGDIHNKPVIVTSHEALLTDNAVGKRWALIYFMAHLFLRDITTANSLNLCSNFAGKAGRGGETPVHFGLIVMPGYSRPKGLFAIASLFSARFAKEAYLTAAFLLIKHRGLRRGITSD